jgi:hypothetical protein
MDKGKIEQLGEEAQKKALKWKIEGLSYQAIADKISEEHSFVTKEEVEGFLKRKKTQIFQVAREDKNFREKMAHSYWDTINQLKDLNAEMLEFFYALKKNPDTVIKKAKCPECGEWVEFQISEFNTLLKTADVLLRQIKHADETIRKAQENSLNITVNMFDATQKIVKIMPEVFEIAERRGIIKKWNKSKLRDFMDKDK